MTFNYHGLSSCTDYHAKVHLQENKEKAFFENASLTLIPEHVKCILLDTVCDKYVAPRTA